MTNNFWWNRRWTFRAQPGQAEVQAPRFFAVSVVAFLFALGVLELLVSVPTSRSCPRRRLAIIAATPLNFIGNKLGASRIEARATNARRPPR